jgi:hypothetical protein
MTLADAMIRAPEMLSRAAENIVRVFRLKRSSRGAENAETDAEKII